MGLTDRAFKGRTPEARSCHTLLVARRHIAGRLPRSRFIPVSLRRSSASPIKEAERRTARTCLTVQCEISGWETDGYTL